MDDDDDVDMEEFMKEYSSETLPHQTTTAAQALLLILVLPFTVCSINDQRKHAPGLLNAL